MVSVAFAIWPFLNACHWQPAPARGVPITCASRERSSKRRANFEGGPAPVWRRYCIATGDRWALQYDVDVLSGFSEPDGPDGAVAGGSLVSAEIPPSGAARRIGSGGRPALGRAGADLALHPHL